MALNNLKIGLRLSAGFALILTLVIAMTVFGLNSMGHIEHELDDILNNNNVEQNLAVGMRVSLFERMVLLRNVILLTDAADMQKEMDAIRIQRTKYTEKEENLNAMFAINGTPDEKALMVKIKERETETMPVVEQVTTLGLANKNEEATALLVKNLDPLQAKWKDTIGELVTLETKLNAEAGASAHASYVKTRSIMLAIAALATLLGVAMAYFLTRSVTLPIQEAVRIAEKVAAGDLTSVVNVAGKDEAGQLLQALKNMNASLIGIVGNVRTGTEVMATASGQIASGNLDLSSRTEQQAASLEETASSMEELTATVKQNADNAKQANQMAVAASGIAVRGGAVVSQVVETMDSINTSAKKIVDIIAVIDGIAFQTNILALNSAVEAARAGEQGRGFAVVASEVRSLAQRSAAAAKEIKTLIGDSVEKVDAGSKQVAEAGSTMDEIVGSVKRVTDIMAEIMAASQEQSAGIEQVNQAIGQMDQVTQQNAALVEEAAAAAESMQEQAAQLAQTVAVFKLATLTKTLKNGEQQIAKPFTSRQATLPPLAGKTYPARLASSPKKISPLNITHS